MSLPGPLTDDRLRAAVLQAGTRLTEGHGESCDCATCLVVQPLVDAALASPAPDDRLRAAAQAFVAAHWDNDAVGPHCTTDCLSLRDLAAALGDSHD